MKQSKIVYNAPAGFVFYKCIDKSLEENAHIYYY